jgi:hypothetical protein
MSDQGSDDGQRGASSDTYSDEETEQRVKDALRRALSTPPHHKTAKATKLKQRPASKGRMHKGKSRD